MVEANTCRTDVMFMVALLFFSVKDFRNSEIWFKEVLKQQPHALVYHELGRICMFTGRMSEAMEYRKKAIGADPNNSRICYGYATDLIRVGRAQEGVDLLRKAVELAPADPLTGSKLLWSLSFLPDVNPQMLLDEHKKWTQIHAPVSLARTSHDNVPDPDRRLRIGYISPDFRKHSVAYNFEAFLDGRGADAVEVYGYGNIGLPDEVTERLKGKFDHYRHIRGLSDKAVAEMIEQDRIDILVEIGGHTVDNRLGVLAHKPAPIQVDYGGISTTGMQQVDYRLTDSILDSPESQEFYVEESVYLPGGLLCYKPPDSAPPVGPLAAARNGYVTFASFNNSCKINDNTMALWAQILRENENSRLLMKFRGGHDRSVKDYYLNRFGQLGIGRDRVETCGWKSSAEHLELYNRVDIALDTYPYTGCLTTLEAMWMGVPVITLVGDRSAYFLSRAGASMLTRIGLESLAVWSPAEYVAMASALSHDLNALAAMRSSMRQRIATSTLCDAKAYARAVEAAYRKMWHRWCENQNAHASDNQDANSPKSEQIDRSSAPTTSCPGTDCLKSLTLSDLGSGTPVASGDMPDFFSKANETLRAGDIGRATEILNGRNIELVRRIVQYDPSRTDIMFTMARLFFDTKQLDKAEEWYKKILERQTNGLAVNELARICKLSGRLTEEVQYRRRASQATPDNTEIFIQFILSVIRTG
ncbi:MAG: O-linked N-acetylglucosamine transferase family protein, partial [Planctomycetota bacterium]